MLSWSAKTGVRGSVQPYGKTNPALAARFTLRKPRVQLWCGTSPYNVKIQNVGLSAGRSGTMESATA